MPVLEWSPSLSVGVASIDSDHQLLFSLIADVDRAVQEKEETSVIGSLLRSLADYTDYHFAREERIMEVCADPALANHKEYHDRLRAEVGDVSHHYADDPDGVDFDHFRGMMREWWVDHILRVDVMMKPFVLANADKVAAIGEMPLVDLSGIEEDALSEDLEWQI
ncbi:MAG: hemerythrin family protein [Alphaproteobacteria bacterium]|nr:hemerythrin family protein [Alphaproteobacteria bacterium]